MNCKTRA
jgi:hypothetical protein